MDQVDHAPAADWRALWNRVQLRLITALDVVSILICDAVILGAGYVIINLTEHLDGSRWSPRVLAFFETARSLSAGLFLLLYVVVVGFHLWRFCTHEFKSKEP
jgi:hypothetical protein